MNTEPIAKIADKLLDELWYLDVVLRDRTGGLGDERVVGDKIIKTKLELSNVLSEISPVEIEDASDILTQLYVQLDILDSRLSNPEYLGKDKRSTAHLQDQVAHISILVRELKSWAEGKKDPSYLSTDAFPEGWVDTYNILSELSTLRSQLKELIKYVKDRRSIRAIEGKYRDVFMAKESFQRTLVEAGIHNNEALVGPLAELNVWLDYSRGPATMDKGLEFVLQAVEKIAKILSGGKRQ